MKTRQWIDPAKPYTAEEIAAGVPDRDARFKRDPSAPPLGNVTQWNGGWSITGEVPASAGKLVGSRVVAGALFLAFECGLYVVNDGKLEPFGFAPVAPIGG
jgi:hypothetical protein